MTRTCSLRDRKKAATRDALGKAAMTLGRKLGVDAVTADVIAAEAGVSTRTFHNYFANKEEAILHHIEASAFDWFDMLRERPADEHIWDSLRQVAIEVVTDDSRDLAETFAVAQLIELTPAVFARKMELDQTLTQALGDAIAERTGTNIETDLYPNLLHMAAGGAVKAALTLWHSGNSGASSPRELVEQAFDQLQAGLPQPAGSVTTHS